VVLASFETHGMERRQRLPTALRSGDAPVDERKFDIFERRRASEEIEALKYEADVVPSEERELVEIEAADIHAAKAVGAARGSIEAPDHVHARRFPGPARADDGDELAVSDRQAHARERVHLGVAMPVNFGDVAKLQQRARVREGG
jgi:hypothetical protein